MKDIFYESNVKMMILFFEAGMDPKHFVEKGAIEEHVYRQYKQLYFRGFEGGA